MPTKKDTAPNAESDSTLLAKALDQNEAVKEVMEQTAAELMVINAVLQTELPENAQSPDVEMALERNDALEAMIHETTQDIAEVNESLSREIEARAELERKLAATAAALAHAAGQSPKG